MTWRCGLRNTCKGTSVAILLVCLVMAPAWGKSYKSTLKKWTRHNREYQVKNLKMSLQWNATYLSDEMRKARQEKINSLLAWSADELRHQTREDQKAASKYDEFFVGIYGDSKVGQWRIFLEANGELIKPVSMERVSVTKVEEQLYPHLDHWSKAYLLRYPKSIKDGDSFSLVSRGLPDSSELVWK